jgi:hypothetical protein
MRKAAEWSGAVVEMTMSATMVAGADRLMAWVNQTQVGPLLSMYTIILFSSIQKYLAYHICILDIAICIFLVNSKWVWNYICIDIHM